MQSWICSVIRRMPFSNSCANLKFYKSSVKGIVHDYCINFNKDYPQIDLVVRDTLELFKQLIESFQGRRITARLVAKVIFIHVNELTQEITERGYHFPSFSTEPVVNVEEFYIRHMQKIANRLDDFHVEGSNLQIKTIAHIHICLNVL